MSRIFVISDGTGGTAELTLRAALAQFNQADAEIQTLGEVRTEDQVKTLIEEAARVGGFVVHTVVSINLRAAIIDLGRLHDVETIDLMGPLLAKLSLQLHDVPSEKPGLFRKLNKEYFNRIEAMEFAFRHDDGQRAHQLQNADIVLVGVSRTFKTPLSIYLAFKGWLVGNVPVILDLPVPSTLFELEVGKVFCLTTRPRHLSVLRSVRHEHLGGATGNYATEEYVREELSYANRIFARRPDWPIIDVTKKPIEEISSEILSKMRASGLVRETSA